MKKLPIFITSSLLLFNTTPVAAATVIQNGSSSVSVNVHTESNTGNNKVISNNGSTNINISESDGNASVNVNNNEFTISGTVKSVSGDNLNISGQNIKSNLTQPSVGQKVTVKGKVENGVMIATSISSDGASSSSVLGTSSPKPAFSSSPKTSSSPTISPSPSNSASESTQAASQKEVKGLFEEIKEFLLNLFSFFKKN